MSKVANPILTAAMDYASQGLCIIPVKPGTKQAACKWKPYQTQRPVLVADTEMGYWELYLTAEEILIQKESLELANRQLPRG